MEIRQVHAEGSVWWDWRWRIHGSKIESGKIKKRDFVLPFCHYSTPKQHG